MQFLKSVGQALYRAWMAFAKVLGHINGAIILTVVYIILIGPYAIARRIGGLFSRDPEVSTYWVPKVQDAPTIESVRRIF